MKSTIIINSKFLELPMVGTTRLSIELCRELLKRDLDILFVGPRTIKHEDVANEFQVKKIGFLSGSLWEQIELPIYLMFKKKYLLVNFTNSGPLFIKNSIVSILDIIPLINREWVSKKAFIKSKLLLPILSKQCLKIITISEYSKKDIINVLKVKEEKVKVIYCGVKPFQLLKKHDREKNSKNYILAVSSLEPRKNFISVIEAFNKLNDENLYLVLVGPNFKYYMPKLLPYINEKRTIIKGYVSDEELKELYSNALAFIYPSLYEGFGLPPLEAMQYGCPVITSNLTSIPEICGDAVLYVNPLSTDEIALAIDKLLKDNTLRQTLIEKGYNKVKQYSWSRTADLLITCIKEIENKDGIYS